MPDEKVVPLDISGGYKSPSIPLAIHYLSDEVLIGDDAYTFELEEESLLCCDFTQAKNQWIYDYFKLLMDKVKDRTSNNEFSELVLIHDELSFISKFVTWFSEGGMKPSNGLSLRISELPIEMAIGGYIKTMSDLGEAAAGNSNKHFLWISPDHVLGFAGSIKAGQVTILKEDLNIRLNTFDEYIKNLLANEHFNIGFKEIDSVQKHKVNQLYDGQKMILWKMWDQDKDVSLYSSISFPPKKIFINSREIKMDMSLKLSKWKAEIKDYIQDKEDLRWCVTGDMVLLKEMTNDSFASFKRMDDLTVLGAKAYLEVKKTGIELVKTEEYNKVFGFMEEDTFIPIFKDGEPKGKLIHYQADLIFTKIPETLNIYSHEKDDLIDDLKLEYKLKLLKKDELQRIHINIFMNKRSEIEEVRYELRRL